MKFVSFIEFIAYEVECGKSCTQDRFTLSTHARINKLVVGPESRNHRQDWEISFTSSFHKTTIGEFTNFTIAIIHAIKV